MIGTFFSFPQFFYWIAFLAPVLSLIGAFAYDYYTSGSFDLRVPLPSSLLSTTPAQSIFGWAMVPTVISMIKICFDVFVGMGKFKGKKSKTSTYVIARYVSALMFILGIVGLIGMSFFTIRDTKQHLISHAGFLLFQVIAYLVVDYSFNSIQRNASTFILAYDAFLFVLVLFYLIAGYFKVFSNKGVHIYAVGILGFLVIFMEFIRYPMLGWQMKGKAFFEAKKAKSQ